MQYDKEYDETNPESIEQYGKRLIGKTFNEVCDEDDANRFIAREQLGSYASEHGNRNRKGGLGQIIEERYFHYKANNDARADFEKAGVELKVTPYKKNKNGSLVAKERLVLSMIDYFSAVNETFEESHLWQKSKLILLVYYLYEKEIKDRLDYCIDFVKLFTPPEEDVEIIKHDYEVIVDKIRKGKAHELSEGDTLYLGAAPKASTSADRRMQPFSKEPAKPRAFTYKNSYMTYVLNNYIIPGKDTYEPIIKDVKDTEKLSFEEYVVERFDKFRNYSEEELCKEFDIVVEEKRKPKNLEAILAYRILGIKGNKAAEFEKANVVLKTIRINANNKIKEHMSFPAFKFKEIVEEDWENSTFGNYLRETRFLFVIFKYDNNGILMLKGSQFWNIPYEDLEGDVRNVWEETKRVIIEGVKVEKRGKRNTNNFPKMSNHNVCHVRPHGKNANDTYELPDGRQYTKQCFWLNNRYVFEQLESRFKK